MDTEEDPNELSGSDVADPAVGPAIIRVNAVMAPTSVHLILMTILLTQCDCKISVARNHTPVHQTIYLSCIDRGGGVVSCILAT